jgi:hypothetical protein
MKSNTDLIVANGWRLSGLTVNGVDSFANFISYAHTICNIGYKKSYKNGSTTYPSTYGLALCNNLNPNLVIDLYDWKIKNDSINTAYLVIYPFSSNYNFNHEIWF